MRIALVVPLAEAVPPKFYGGTERVVSWLAEELVRQGHRVTLFASAESETAADFFVCNAQSLRLVQYREDSWLTRQSTANPSARQIPCDQGKEQGNFKFWPALVKIRRPNTRYFRGLQKNSLDNRTRN